MFQHRVITKVFPLRGRKLHNVGVHISFSSPGIVSVMKARRVRWAGRVTRMEWKKNGYRGLVGKFEGSLKKLGTQGNIILKWIFKK